MLDWINDFEAEPISAQGFPGFVHAGFSGAWTAFAPHLADEVQRQRVGALAQRPLLITGHSKDEPEKQVYIVGKATDGRWAGLKTTVVET